MSRVGRIVLPVVLPLACIAAVAARAAGPDKGPVASMAATLRAVDAARGVIVVEQGGGGRTELGVDGTDTLTFKGIRTLALDELAEGMQLDIDYRRAAGGAMPRATWIEVIEGGRVRGAAADGNGRARPENEAGHGAD